MTDAVTVSDEKLAPCPFCASDMSDFVSTTPAGYASAAGGFLAVECVCGVTGPFAPSMTEAIAAWNHRALVSEIQQRREREGEQEPVAWRWKGTGLVRRGWFYDDEEPQFSPADRARMTHIEPLFASPTSPTEVKALREAGWLIELKPSVVKTPCWFQLDEEWTEDASKALRFARKQDADAFIAHIGWTEAFASEHEWSAPLRHEWWEWHGLTCCKNCGIVRRADGGNDDKPCRGEVKVGPRSALQGVRDER